MSTETSSRYTLEEKLEFATEKLASAQAALDRANGLGDRAHEMGGGIPGFGGSGNQQAARQVRAAHESAQRAWKEATERVSYWSDKVKRLEFRKAEHDRPRLTLDDIKGAKWIRTTYGWCQVVRVNAKSVSVASGYDWVDRVALDKVLEVKK